MNKNATGAPGQTWQSDSPWSSDGESPVPFLPSGGIEGEDRIVVILCGDGNIRSHHLPPNLQTVAAASHDLPETFKGTMAGMEKEIIIDELRRSRGNMAKAARTLGITERMIGLRVAKYGIDPGKFK